MKKFKILTIVLSLFIGHAVMLHAQYNEGADMPQGRKVRIQSAMSYGRSAKGFLEFPGREWKTKGNQMDIWTKDSNKNKLFFFNKTKDGYFTIEPTDVNGAIDSKDVPPHNGTPLHLWEPHRKESQQFYFKHLGNGRYKIYHSSGKVVCLKDSKTDENGNKVHLWSDHNAITTEWFILDATTNKPIVVDKTVGVVKKRLRGDKINTNQTFFIQSALCNGRSNKGYLELGSRDWNKKGNPAQIWEKGGFSDNKQFKFELTPEGDYYIIHAAKSSDGVLDCKGGSTDKGTQIHLWSKHGGDSQKFYLRKLANGSYKIYHKSGKVLCLKENRSDKNGNKLHLWDDHDSITTEWYLTPAK